MNKVFIILIVIFCDTGLFAGNWTNGGGNEKRNGLSDIPGPNAATVFWQGTDNGFFGTQVYIEANKLVTMRFISMTNAPVVCHDLYTGQLLWSKDVTYGAGRSLPIGIKNGNVYVVRYTESNDDSLIALNVVNGERVWATKPGIAISITGSAVFAPNGDLIVDGGGYKLLRIDHTNGSTVWNTYVLPCVVGYLEPVIYNNTVYVWENAGFNDDITAVDLTTGTKKYSKQIPDTYPGGPLQQMAPMAGSNGIIHAYKLGDNVTALQDNGSALNILWTTPVIGNNAFSLMAEGPDSTIYIPSNGRVIRLGKTSGVVIDSSEVLGSLSLMTARITTGPDGKVYIASGDLFICTNQKLATLFTENIPGLNTSGPAIGPNNILALAGSGTNLKVYKTSVTSIGYTGNLIGDYSLSQNYPNPFNPTTKIKFDIPRVSNVKVTVYNITGKEISILVNKKLSPGSYEVEFNGYNYSSGIYFYRLETNDFIQINKMILLK